MKILFALILSISCRAQMLQVIIASGSTGGGGGSGYSRSITIDHTKVPNTDQANFPVLVSGTYTYLKTIGNGGKVNNASGYDIIFCTTADCSSQISSCEVEFWDGSTGAFAAWVKIGLVTTGSDTVFYVGYGNTTISTNQCSPTGVWSNGFSGVWHLPNGTSLGALDSTSNGNNGTVGANTAVAGQIDGAAAITTNLTLPETANGVWNVGDFTQSIWFKGTTDALQLFYSQNGTPLFALLIGDFAAQCGGSNKFVEYIRTVGIGSVQCAIGTTTVNDNAWHYGVVTRNGTSGEIKLYTDGSLEDTRTNDTGTISTGSSGSHYFGPSANTDEGRISTTVRTADWISTEYNNQSSPSTFYAFGAEHAI